jgi:hypothetical protein
MREKKGRVRGKQGNRGFWALGVDLPVRTAHTAITFQRTLHPTVKLAAREYICRDYFSALNARHRDLSARNLVF